MKAPSPHSCYVRGAAALGAAIAVSCGMAPAASAQTITTVAGTADIAGRRARSISLRPWGIAPAPGGTFYVADSEHSQVLRFDPVADTFSVVAGTTIAGNSGDGGPATDAQLVYPAGVAVDAAGNLFIADAGERVIRRVSAASGEISTVAGGGWNPDDGPATDALLQGTWAVTIGPNGDIYILEQDFHRVRRVAAHSGFITTIAGTGTWGYEGDGGPATTAQLARPGDVAFDAVGNLYIADSANNRIRIVNTATGIIGTFAGTGDDGWEAVDGQPAIATPLGQPAEIEFDAQGNLLVTEQATGRIRRIDAATTIVTTIAGGGSEVEGVPAVFGRLDMPQGLALAANGDVYVTSNNTYIIQRVVAESGMLEVVAGNGEPHQSGDGGQATLAQIWPRNGISNASGDLFAIDGLRLRTVDHISGTISTFAGAGPNWGVVGDGGPAIDAFLSWPTAMTMDAEGNIFVSDQGNQRIRRIDAATGIIDHYAGRGYGYGGDNGPAVNAQMRGIRDMATDSQGNLFVVEEGSPRVRRIDAATGIISTIAGNGNYTGPWGDGGLASSVALYPLGAIALDSQSNIYLVQGSRIRRIDFATGIITTVAGNGAYGDTGDGGPALQAALDVWDIALDGQNNIFVAGVFGHRVRRIDAAAGTIATVAGNGQAGYAGDGGPAIDALLNGPSDLSFDADGNLYVTETYHIRRIAGIGAPAQSPDPDTTGPQITVATSGPQGADDWYVGDVAIEWSMSDAESAISATSGCEAINVTSDTTGETFICSATSAGGTSWAGVTIRRDATAPVIEVVQPVDGASYGLYSRVPVELSCVDETSGTATCTDSQAGGYLDTTQAGARTLTLTATDAAGNSTTRDVAYEVASTFAFQGFLTPLGNPPLVNVVKPGRVIPIRWRLPDPQGGYISDPQTFLSIAVRNINCPGGTRRTISQYASGAAGLSYDSANQWFLYKWPTSSGWRNCRAVDVTLRDGSVHTAYFLFKP